MPRADWKTSDSYDPYEIHIESSDRQGHSSNLRCRVPKPWAGAIAAIVQSDEWPEIRTSQDFIRDAIFHRLHFVADIGDRGEIPGLRQTMAQARIDQALNAYADTLERVKTMKELIDRTFEESLANKDHEHLTQFIDRLQQEISDEYREPFKTRLLGVLARWEKEVSFRGEDWWS